jgi:hypothetical protein
MSHVISRVGNSRPGEISRRLYLESRLALRLADSEHRPAVPGSDTHAEIDSIARAIAADKQDRLGLDKINAGGAATAASATAFITNAVQEAKALGLELTAGEVGAFMRLFTRPPISARWYLVRI